MTYKQVFDKIVLKEVKMKIEVNRSHTLEGELIFTIRVSEPHEIDISQDEISIMHTLETCIESIESIEISEAYDVKDTIKSALNDVKSDAFWRLLNKLKFSIENEFRPKFRPICQEIYNWIYDHQKGEVKQWMQEFDPQRTKYYFSNDVTPNKYDQEQESEHDGQG